MQVRALKTFTGRYGMIRKGTTFNAEPSYAEKLLRNKLIEQTDAPGKDEKKKPAGPGDQRQDKSIPAAPGRAGKDAAGQQGESTGSDTAPPPADGKEPPSLSLRQDLASRQKTLTTSAIGGRRGTPTPRKKKLPPVVKPATQKRAT